MLASLGILLFSSVQAGQGNLIGKEVTSEDATQVIGGACGNQFKTQIVKCGGTVLCGTTQVQCSLAFFATLVPKATGSGLKANAPVSRQCMVCSQNMTPCGDPLSAVTGTSQATCDGG